MNERAAVILVDDARVAHVRLREMLAGTSFEIWAAKNAEGLNLILEELLSAGRAPAALILDLVLSRSIGDGIRVYRAFRSQFDNVPVIIWSKHSLGDEELLLDDVNLRVIEKYIGDSNLEEVINEMISKREEL